MSLEQFVGQWVVTEVCGKTEVKVGDHINNCPEGNEQIRIEISGHFYFSEVACWEPGTPGKLVFTRDEDIHCTVELRDNGKLHCVENAGPATDTGSWTADDSSGPWEEG